MADMFAAQDIETSLLTFATNTLGLDLYDWQVDAIEPFDDLSEHLVQVSLATPNESGKSSVVIPALILGHLALHRQGKVILTTADGKQLDNQVMTAIETHRNKFGAWRFVEREVTTPTGGRFVAFTTDEPGRAEGWHPSDVLDGPLLVICDEAKSIPESIFSALDRCGYNGILLCSSPGRMNGTFYESQHNQKLGYRRIAVGLKDCPHITQDKIARIIAKYGASSPFARSALHGEFVEAFDGKPVYYAYNQDIHEAENLSWPRGAMLIRGHDVGTFAATVWSAYWIDSGIEYWHDLYEFYAESFDADRHAREVLRITDTEFEFWNDRGICAGVFDYIDPAARNSSYTRQITVDGKSVKESALNIFRTHGIYPQFTTKARGLHETIAVINRLLEQRDKRGLPCYQVDRKWCPMLVRGFRGGYRWPTAEEVANGNQNLPLKGLVCNNLDHLQDGSRFGKINALRILGTGAAKPKPSNLPRPKNPNPNRRKW